MSDRARAGNRENQAQRRAAAGERDAFGKHLTQQPQTPRAQCRPHRHFLLPRPQPRQLQIRKIRTHNQHHHSNRTGQHHQGRTHSSVHVPLQWSQPRLDRVSFRMLDFELFCQHRELSLSARGRGARPQPADCLHSISMPVVFLSQGIRNEYIHRSAGRKNAREIEGRRQYTHHHYWLTVQRQLPSNHSPVCGKPPLPKAVTQQSGRWSVGSPATLLDGERSSDHRLHTQQREEVLGNGSARQALRLAGSR